MFPGQGETISGQNNHKDSPAIRVRKSMVKEKTRSERKCSWSSWANVLGQSALMFATFVPSQFDIEVSVWGFPGSSDGKDLPAVQKTWVWSLDWEDPLGMGTATHSSVLAWTIPWAEDPGWLHSMGSQRVKHNWANFTFSVHFPGSSSSKEPIWKCRRHKRHGFDPWVQTIP